LFFLFLAPGCVMARPLPEGPPFNAEAWAIQKDSDTLRVRILHVHSAFQLGASGAWEYCPSAGGACQAFTKSVTVRRSSRGLSIGNHSLRGSVWVRSKAMTDFLSINKKSYRGKLHIVGTRNGYLDVIELVDMEEYLYGVLPREVGANWPMESLKAQAVISRTFALANKATDPAQLFDLLSDVRSQAYGGRSVEALGPTRAVDETKGQVLLGPDGKPIEAFFHSSCGGMTEKPDRVWTASYANDVFANVEDTFCSEDPFRVWHLTLNAALIQKRLRHIGLRIGTLKDIQIKEKSPSGRAETLVLLWRGGKKEISGNRFRLAVGPEALRSTLLTEISYSHGRFSFSGRGWGHGVGLCQYGARGRAAAGQTYEQILKAYYPGAVLQKAATGG
jgi:stage II sporulation protein D